MIGHRGGSEEGNIVQLPANQATIPVYSCSAVAGPENVSLFSAVSASFALLVRLVEKKAQNNIRSAAGTPVDSGRFRQAPDSSRQAQ
jgi:hypothetical protein